MRSRFFIGTTIAMLAGLAGLAIAGSGYCPIPGDIDGDNDVDLTDLATLLSNFGKTSDVDAGLVAYFPFDTDLNDHGTHAFNVTPHGSPTLVTGRVGGAAAFDGVDDWLGVQHGGALSFDIDNGSYSIAFWVEVAPTLSHDATVLQDRGAAANTPTSFSIGEHNGRQAFEADVYYGTPVGDRYASISRTQLLGGWKHVAATYQSDGVHLFIDGVQVAVSGVLPAGYPSGGATLATIGAGYFSGIQNFFTGNVDELRFYNRALSSEEICTLAGQ